MLALKRPREDLDSSLEETSRCSKKQHMESLEQSEPLFKLEPPFQMDTLNDLIDFAWRYTGTEVDWLKLWELIPSLEKLNAMIGMDDLKKSIVDVILYYTQGFHMVENDMGEKVRGEDMLHTVITGSPGSGKTTVAKILAEIYSKLGCVDTDEVVVVKLTDFIGKYVGHTEHKTNDLLESCIGKVMVIDEAYTLDKDCKFSLKALNALNEFLYTEKNNFICIIIGYKNSIQKNFMEANQGLERRFPIRYKVDDYNASDLAAIFKKKVKEEKWTMVEDETVKKIIAKNFDLFTYFGGDIENYLRVCKSSHIRRTFGLGKEALKKLTKEDLLTGIDKFKESKQEPQDKSYLNLYI